jgi:hypothetical protein
VLARHATNWRGRTGGALSRLGVRGTAIATVTIALASVPALALPGIASSAGVPVGLTSVSCPSSSFCEVTDTNGNARTFKHGSPKGSSTSLEKGSESVQLTSVSCPTSKFCAAVDSSGQAFDFNGNFWSRPVSVDPSGKGLNAVSCTSSKFCMAVDSSGQAVTYNGSAWSAPAAIDPAGGGLISVSCARSFCAAVDDKGRALTFARHAWSAPHKRIPYLLSISCPTSSFCVATTDSGFWLTYQKGAWKAHPRIDTIGVDSVSCLSSSFCIGVDEGIDSLTYRGRSWSQPALIPSKWPGGPAESYSFVSCASTKFCVAVNGTLGLSFTFTGRSWSKGIHVS